jgi:hypothetical protein
MPMWRLATVADRTPFIDMCVNDGGVFVDSKDCWNCRCSHWFTAAVSLHHHNVTAWPAKMHQLPSCIT